MNHAKHISLDLTNLVNDVVAEYVHADPTYIHDHYRIVVRSKEGHIIATADMEEGNGKVRTIDH